MLYEKDTNNITGPREFHLTGKIASGMENILY